MTSPTQQPPPYDPLVPEFPSDTLDDTQGELQNNFLQLYNKFLRNHIPLDAVTDAGNHTIIQLTEQSAPFQTDLGEISVYTKDVEGQTDQIFMRYQGNGQEFQFTNYQIYALPRSNFQIKYFTFLPGKLLVYFGTVFPTANANILDLSPYISKNIMTMDFCPITQANILGFKPSVALLAPQNGYIKGIQLFNSFSTGGTAPSCYYLVMANL